MSILDDAIREHLELKRQRGAPDDEVKKLEDEAFGPPARPDDQEDPFAEAPTEFMEQPEGRPAPNIADLQEAPLALEPEPAAAAELAPEPEAEVQVPDEPEAPAEEEQPAGEHETISDIADDSAASHTTQERHAIAEQPTEMFDVQGELAEGEEPEAPAPAAEPAPSDEELVESELEEPRFAAEPPLAEPSTPAPPPAAPAPAFDEEDDFFDEQRLSDELDQALEAPLPPLEEEEEEPVAEVTSPPTEEAEAVEPEATEEHSVLEPEEGHEDVLEDTPDFLEESPEDDQLWFEQKPPKDFDFDD